MKKLNIYFVLNLILLPVLLFMVFNVLKLRAKHHTVIAQNTVIFENGDFIFKVVRKDPSQGKMIIGDLLGTNVVSSRILQKASFKDPDPRTQIMVARSSEIPVTNITKENFLEMISTDNGVVIADNFCIAGWEQIRTKDLYQHTSLSPGPYCFSEPQALLIDNLIKRYHVTEVDIYYDTSSYLELIDTFLKYLKETNIAYNLIDSADGP